MRAQREEEQKSKSTVDGADEKKGGKFKTERGRYLKSASESPPSRRTNKSGKGFSDHLSFMFSHYCASPPTIFLFCLNDLYKFACRARIFRNILCYAGTYFCCYVTSPVHNFPELTIRKETR